jgi:hypothetical protein
VGRLLQRRKDRAGSCDDQVRRERDQFRSVSAVEINIARAPACVDPQVASGGPTEFLQPLQKRRDASLPFQIVRSGTHEYADAPHSLALLRGPPRSMMNSRRFNRSNCIR